ncbi:glycerate kinase [Staphylococcus gallinarum]|uniref:glycerate kinase n=1 Tax=Staphylococcus gallinarum TaxID=1293 RepID=UPI000D1EEB22|nr:glycerate kinase [Staphylococcus gallinarum]PTK95649.1 glycerate kinase [Staphylococcus gallinarum]PTK96970.1 glycerate kinase [Staphylococcus gallinarum]RIO91305.1 glycerate kinase [Staphylococcus gallinarum]
MNIILAPDSFKGSMSSTTVTKLMHNSITSLYPNATVQSLPMGDGGEGTMEALINATNGQLFTESVTGPIGEQVQATYGVLGDGETCIVEMAEASGLRHLNESQLNALETTTYGTGELILSALNKGYQQFILAIGGSATNDAGAGMLQALGAQLLDAQGNAISFGGGSLADLDSINLSTFDNRIAKASFIIASDVNNPLVGPEGASFVFGKQKGASDTELQLLDNNLLHFANIVESEVNIHIHDFPGAGAAGGLGGAFKAFFPCEFRNGIDVVIEYSKLTSYLAGADLILSGEGKIDHQSLYGKTPIGVARCAQRFNVPVILIGGTVDIAIEKLHEHGILSAFSLVNGPKSLADTLAISEQLLQGITKNIVSTFFFSKT